MKKAMIIFMAMFSLAITAQNENRENRAAKGEFRQNLSPEQKAELMSKKMTLSLNLTDLQQEKVKQLFLEMEKEKPTNLKDRKEMTADERYDFQKRQMDRKISIKRKLKVILDQQQFEKWEKRSGRKQFSKRHNFRVSKNKEE